MTKRLCVLTKRLYMLMKRSLRQINAMNGMKAVEDALLKRQKAVKMPGASQTVIKTNVQHSILHEKLQARMAKQKHVRKRPPAFNEGQAVEINIDGTGYVKGIITGMHPLSIQSRQYDVHFPESGVRESKVPERLMRARQTTKVRFEFLPLVQELRRKVQYDFYDDPVDGDLIPGYYNADEDANNLSITAWNTQAMCFSWMEAKAQMQQYANVAAVNIFNLKLYALFVLYVKCLVSTEGMPPVILHYRV